MVVKPNIQFSKHFRLFSFPHVHKFIILNIRHSKQQGVYGVFRIIFILLRATEPNQFWWGRHTKDKDTSSTQLKHKQSSKEQSPKRDETEYEYNEDNQTAPGEGSRDSSSERRQRGGDNVCKNASEDASRNILRNIHQCVR